MLVPIKSCTLFLDSLYLLTKCEVSGDIDGTWVQLGVYFMDGDLDRLFTQLAVQVQGCLSPWAQVGHAPEGELVGNLGETGDVGHILSQIGEEDSVVRPVVQQVDQGTLLTLVYVDNRGPEISLSSNTKIYVRIAFKQGNPIHMGEHIIIEEKILRDGEAFVLKYGYKIQLETCLKQRKWSLT